ncbi:MAG: DUF2273 domain-containing protein [Eubacteriales bacterium]|nr:DUF2273 domain-containing protein [Eubacteriales bacterium]
MSDPMLKRLIGAVVGVVCALMIIFFGFWKTLLIALLAAVGWWAAGSRKIPQAVLDFAARIFRLH